MKAALVITGHVLDSKRKGGFHSFINFLIDAGYDVDWMTTPVHAGWLIRWNDKDNPKNFFKLWKGYTIKRNGRTIRCFTVPMVLHGKVAKFLHLSSTAVKVPKWESVKKRLHDMYDIILVESVGAPFGKKIRLDYPNSKILYRPSDTLFSLTHDKIADVYEKRMINNSDEILCVDENSISYYGRIGVDQKRLSILRNPLAINQDIEFLKQYNPCNRKKRKQVVYVGVSFFYKELVEYAASKNQNSDFIIIGPFKKKKVKNVHYLGSMSKDEFEKILANADVGIAPIKQPRYALEHGLRYGYTGKIISYMKYLLPIVATCSPNYLGVEGFYNVSNDYEKFSNAIKHCLEFSIEDRKKLREGYLKILSEFSEDNSRSVFVSFL